VRQSVPIGQASGSASHIGHRHGSIAPIGNASFRHAFSADRSSNLIQQRRLLGVGRCEALLSGLIANASICRPGLRSK